MKLEQLRYFVQIVESHSFNQAAQSLYMTQPALTTSIQALEEELQPNLPIDYTQVLVNRPRKPA